MARRNEQTGVAASETFNPIIWVVGIVDAFGHVESVIKRHDDYDVDITHEELFGNHGTRWRAIDIGDVTWYGSPTQEERIRVKDHIEPIFENE